MIDVALIGFGAISQNLHLPLLQSISDFNVSAVCSSQPELVKQHLPEASCYDSIDKLLAQSKSDLVIIATPNHSHFPLAIKALKAARHVVIEKPVALEVKEIQELQRQATEHDVHVFPFHNRRWDGDFQTVASLIANRRLGEVKRFESNFDRFRPEPSEKWKEQAGQGTGIWFDLAPHLLDQAFYLFGSPEAITARILKTRTDSAADDYFHATLHYPAREVIIGASNHNAGPVQRFSIQGSKGSFVKFGMDAQERHLQARLSVVDTHFGQDNEENYGKLYLSDTNQPVVTETVATLQGNYRQFYQEVVEAIRFDKPAPVSIKAAIEVTRFLQLGLVSHRQGKTIKVRQYRDE